MIIASDGNIFRSLMIVCVLRLGNGGNLRRSSIAHSRQLTDDECKFPCDCSEQEMFDCSAKGRGKVIDGCGCCYVCTRQLAETCNRKYVCDKDKSLECVLQPGSKHSGICLQTKNNVSLEAADRGCMVNNIMFRNGEQFMLDCKTSCSCQNGTYGCISLCPHELIRPSFQCLNPHLVQLNTGCCKEWLCETDNISDGENSECVISETEWSPCSVTCGLGTSFRMSNQNPSCQMRSEVRVCQITTCNLARISINQASVSSHRIRHHNCRATIRAPSSIHLESNSDPGCISVNKYRPKYCGYCLKRSSVYQQCLPSIVTTKPITFKCVNVNITNSFVTELKIIRYMWISKCVCSQ